MGQLSRLTVASSLLLATLAFADKSVDDARQRFKRGTELYDEGNYRGALVEFERAHQALPNYKMLYNIGQVHLQLLDYAHAQEAFTRYLKEGGSDLGSSRRDEVNRELERLKSRVGRIAVVTADGAEVLIDDELVGVAPLPGSLAANTGRHKVTVNPPVRAPVSRVIDVAGLETSSVTLGRDEPVAPKLAATLATPEVVASARAHEPKSRLPMIIGWTATGVLAVTSGVMAGLAFSSESGLTRARATLGVSQDTLTAASKRVGSFSAAADVLGLAAIVAGGVSLYLTIALHSTDDVHVAVGPGGVSVFAQF